MPIGPTEKNNQRKRLRKRQNIYSLSAYLCSVPAMNQICINYIEMVSTLVKPHQGRTAKALFFAISTPLQHLLFRFGPTTGCCHHGRIANQPRNSECLCLLEGLVSARLYPIIAKETLKETFLSQATHPLINGIVPSLFASYRIRKTKSKDYAEGIFSSAFGVMGCF